ncbi:hypothetical protein [Variovorax sp. JS1663]|uniref:hypothetical protein n=1 Tax=Variovorax sp. JS1663 TaxID=1851577 RepID=UPI000B342B3A|nr:hypothetical protein [Variovorax sp. JS1663]OUL98801.1 hypothetical protein A8M77_29745 [Variovorax sp. JS1663]
MTKHVSPEIAIVRLGEGESAQFAIGALPRVGRLPFSKVEVHSTHLTVTGQDGTTEELGSDAEPLAPEVIQQLLSDDGLVFAELDEDSGEPVATERIKG